MEKMERKVFQSAPYFKSYFIPMTRLKWSRQTLLSSAFTNGQISRAVIKRMNCQEYGEQVKGSRPKQLTFLADMSAKAFSLPP